MSLKTNIIILCFLGLINTIVFNNINHKRYMAPLNEEEAFSKFCREKNVNKFISIEENSDTPRDIENKGQKQFILTCEEIINHRVQQIARDN